MCLLLLLPASAFAAVNCCVRQGIAGGWEALRNAVQQQAAFLPIARAELGGEYGDLGRVNPATDPGSLSVALAEQQQRDRELATPMVAALEQLLREAAGKVDAMDPHQMEEAMRQCAEELPCALDVMVAGVLPESAEEQQLFWDEDLSSTPQSAEDVLDELHRTESSGPALAGLLRAHWPRLLLDKGEGGHAGAAAWRRLAETAEAAEEGQQRCSGPLEVSLGQG